MCLHACALVCYSQEATTSKPPPRVRTHRKRSRIYHHSHVGTRLAACICTGRSPTMPVAFQTRRAPIHRLPPPFTRQDMHPQVAYHLPSPLSRHSSILFGNVSCFGSVTRGDVWCGLAVASADLLQLNTGRGKLRTFQCGS